MKVMWHVGLSPVSGRLPQSRAARSRDAAIKAACELLAHSDHVRRILEPNGMSIERAELDEHYDQGRFPGLRMPKATRGECAAGWVRRFSWRRLVRHAAATAPAAPQ